jgi:hypothetical protein
VEQDNASIIANIISIWNKSSRDSAKTEIQLLLKEVEPLI